MTSITILSRKQLSSIYWTSFTKFIADSKEQNNMKDGISSCAEKELKYMEMTTHSSKDGDTSSSDASCDTLESGIVLTQPHNWLPPEYVSIRADLSPDPNTSKYGQCPTPNKLHDPQITVSPPSCSPIKRGNATLGKLVSSPEILYSDDDPGCEKIEEEWKSELFSDDEDEENDGSVFPCTVQRWMMPDYNGQNGRMPPDMNSYNSERLFPTIFAPTLGAIKEEEEELEIIECEMKKFETMEDLSLCDTESDSDLEEEKEYVLDHSPVEEVFNKSEQEIMVDDVRSIEDNQPVVIEGESPVKLSKRSPPSEVTTAPPSDNTSPSSVPGVNEHSDYASTVTDSAYSSHEAIFKYNMDTGEGTTLGVLAAASSPELANLHEETTIDYIPVSYATEASAKRKGKRRRATYASTSNAILPIKKITNSHQNSPKHKSNKSGLTLGTIRKRLSWRKSDRISISTPNLTTKPIAFSPDQSPVSVKSSASASNLPKTKRPSGRKRFRRAMSSIIRRLSSRRINRGSPSSSKDKTIIEEETKYLKNHCVNTISDAASKNKDDAVKRRTLPVTTNETAPKVHERKPHEGARSRSYSTPAGSTRDEVEITNCTDDSDVITEVNLSANTIVI